MHNGQPSGAQDPNTTEDGAYTFSGPTSVGPRNFGARWWLPNEDEWYKAAYYNASAGIYYDYPTGTNNSPNNNPPSNDSGNSANFWNNSFTTGNSDFPLTDVGAYTLAPSKYGTFDQGGNTWEWTETFFDSSSRVVRGGSWDSVGTGDLHASFRIGFGPTTGGSDIGGVGVSGFRLATIPEPATAYLVAMGMTALLWCRRRRPN